MRKLLDGNKSRTELFQKISASATEEEKRKLEMAYMKPEPLPHYSGEAPTSKASDPVGSMAIKILFRDDEHLELFRKHFGLRNYVEPNLRDIEKFELLLQALEEGILQYDKETNRFINGT